MSLLFIDKNIAHVGSTQNGEMIALFSGIKTLRDRCVESNLDTSHMTSVLIPAA
jgi:hypothetical protein